ncbi:MAG: histidine ammonia-lyase [Bacillota bacterium]|nr:histidine ammonia-lyase [Bacillota bacterium]
MKQIQINGDSIMLESLVQFTRGDAELAFTEEARERIRKSRAYVDQVVQDKRVIYGITTGFGKFSDVVISQEETAALQENLIMSHSCGVGKPLAIDHALGVMLLRLNNFAIGHSGVRLETAETLLAMANRRVVPVIPEKGSLGASGDLAPLSHMVLVMMGMGEAFYGGERMSGAEAMKRAGITPIGLAAKEGLALINGTQVMTSIGAHTLYDAIALAKMADVAAGLTMEALRGITDAFDPRLHRVRPHAGQQNTAENILRILEGSKRTTKQGEIRVQDAYTIRCIPQIHGATKDALRYVREKVEIEMNSVTDNPIIFAEDDAVFSGGNFHGQPMALPFDFLGIAISEIANVSERRIERLVNPQLSGLPAFLIQNGGVNSGYMIAQYAAAALVSENKVLAHPASVDSIPSSANQEDHVSMGTIAARKAGEILRNAEYVVAIEMLAALQALDLQGFDQADRLSLANRKVYDIIREKVTFMQKDRVLHLDFETVHAIMRSGEIVSCVEATIGALKC